MITKTPQWMKATEERLALNGQSLLIRAMDGDRRCALEIERKPEDFDTVAVALDDGSRVCQYLSEKSVDEIQTNPVGLGAADLFLNWDRSRPVTHDGA